MNEKLTEQQFDEFKLVQDLLRVTGMNGYGWEFRLQLLKPYDFEVFRIYLTFQGKEYPARVELRAYPFGESTLPKVVFENVFPFCALHASSLHPHLTDVGQVDWEAIRIVPGTAMTITGILAILRALLANPDHSSVVHSCSPHILPLVGAGNAPVDKFL